MEIGHFFPRDKIGGKVRKEKKEERKRNEKNLQKHFCLNNFSRTISRRFFKE